MVGGLRSPALPERHSGSTAGRALRPPGGRADLVLRYHAGRDDRPFGVPDPRRLPCLVLPPADRSRSAAVARHHRPAVLRRGGGPATAAARAPAPRDTHDDVRPADILDRTGHRGDFW